MRAATGKTCDSAHNPTDPGKIALALRTFVHVPPSAFADLERKTVAALLVGDSQIAASLPPFGSVWRDAAPASPKLSGTMSGFVSQRSIDFSGMLKSLRV